MYVENHEGENISLSEFTHIRAYHACRVEDEAAIYKEGLIPFTRKSALETAKKKLPSYKNITEGQVKVLIDELWGEEAHMGRVWFELGTSAFLEQDAHYLIYGSEILNAVFMRLGCRNVLKTIGKPAFVICDVPIGDIASCWLNNLEQFVKDGKAYQCAIAVPCVKPENIISIEYLYDVELWDPYCGTIYKTLPKCKDHKRKIEGTQLHSIDDHST